MMGYTKFLTYIFVIVFEFNVLAACDNQRAISVDEVEHVFTL